MPMDSKNRPEPPSERLALELISGVPIERLREVVAAGGLKALLESHEAMVEALEAAKWALGQAQRLHPLGFNECWAESQPRTIDSTGTSAAEYRTTAEDILESVSEVKAKVRAALATAGAFRVQEAQPDERP